MEMTSKIFLFGWQFFHVEEKFSVLSSWMFGYYFSSQNDTPLFIMGRGYPPLRFNTPLHDTTRQVTIRHDKTQQDTTRHNTIHYCLVNKQYVGFGLRLLYRVIGRTHHVINPVWSRIDWFAGQTIRIVDPSFAEHKWTLKTSFTIVWQR